MVPVLTLEPAGWSIYFEKTYEVFLEDSKKK